MKSILLFALRNGKKITPRILLLTYSSPFQKKNIRRGIVFSFILTFFIFFQKTSAQTLLKADGEGNTYELISSVLAPNYDPIEVPDCGHTDFGRHIDEAFDEELGAYVFRFFIHTTPDNDRCQNFDRQRNEIKTYDQSPDHLIATEGEIVRYKWKFKLDATFQSSASFTHLHQIKAVGGPEEGMPLITLTTRKGTPDKLQLRYAETTSQITLHQVDLSPFKGKWLEVTETILYGEEGQYFLSIVDLEDGSILLDYQNEAIRTWKTDADFLRPKWGIYRSLNDTDNLRDEVILFADFSIEELEELPVSLEDFSGEGGKNLAYPNPIDERLFFVKEVFEQFEKVYVYNAKGDLVLSELVRLDGLDMRNLESGLYFVVLRGKGDLRRVWRVVKQ